MVTIAFAPVNVYVITACRAAASGEKLPGDEKKWTYEEICGLTFKTVLPYDCYKKMGDIYVDYTKFDEVFLEQLFYLYRFDFY